MSYIFSFLFVFIISFSANSETQDNCHLSPDFVCEQYFIGKAGLQIAYRSYKGNGNLGQVIISPGKTESFIKYKWLKDYLLELGYSSVHIIDHRGQGFSERILKDKEKVHVENFQNYIDDFKKFVTEIIVPPKNQKRFLLANSMGGAIAGMYLSQNSDHTFDKVAFTVPMFGIDYRATLNRYISPKITSLFTDNQLNAFIKWYLKCDALNCNKYVRYFASHYKEAKFEDQNKFLTSNKAEFNFIQNLYQKYPQIRLGGPTYQWMNQANKVSDQIQSLAYKIDIPTIILSAENDSLVSKDTHQKVCRQIFNCKVLQLENSLHEVFFEKDSIRQKAISYIHQHFANDTKISMLK